MLPRLVMKLVMTFRVALLAVILLVPAGANAVSGSAQLNGRSTLAVKGCGRDPAVFSGVFLVRDDGTWSVSADGEASFAGTYAAVGRSGRKLVLQLNDPSTSAFVATVEADVSTLCDVPSTVTSARPQVLTLTVNRKRTRAKLVVRYLFRGRAGGRSGTATFGLLARGAWVGV